VALATFQFTNVPNQYRGLNTRQKYVVAEACSGIFNGERGSS